LIAPLCSATYTFYITSGTLLLFTIYICFRILTLFIDDGDILTVNGQEVISDWVPHAAKEDSGTIALVANRLYNISIQYFEQAGDASIEFEWSSSCQTKSVVATSQLYSV
jgi:hypothetical protein